MSTLARWGIARDEIEEPSRGDWSTGVVTSIEPCGTV